MSPFTATFLVTALAFGALFVASLRLDDPGLVHLGWGPAFVLVAAAALATGAGTDPRRFLVLTLVAMWGFRLGAYLYWRRTLHPGDDGRVAALVERLGIADPLLGRAAVFALYAMVIWVVSWPVQWTIMTPAPAPLGRFDLLGVLLWGAGFALEAVADLRLATFRDDPANARKVLDRGVWALSRHPDYFGDACVWWGFYAFACATPNGWSSFVGPVLATALLRRVAAPLIEARLLVTHPDYAAYAARTSAFVPWLPGSAPVGERP